jgi:hypothetical protein
MRRLLTTLILVLAVTQPLYAASDKEPAPPGSVDGAPPQFTKFTAREIERGFMALAFGSDLRIGVRPRGIRRFDGPVRAYVLSSGSIDRSDAMKRVLAEYGASIPHLQVEMADSADAADLIVRLIDEKDFETALNDAFGHATARAFIARTDPQCMTSVKSQNDGVIARAESFIIVDQGDDVFFDCAYHEMLHAFGLSNHDQSNPWTTLNQNRMVGYLSVYDRSLLTLLYDPRLRPGMTMAEVRRVLPRIIRDLKLAVPGNPAGRPAAKPNRRPNPRH